MYKYVFIFCVFFCGFTVSMLSCLAFALLHISCVIFIVITFFSTSLYRPTSQNINFVKQYVVFTFVVVRCCTVFLLIPCYICVTATNRCVSLSTCVTFSCLPLLIIVAVCFPLDS
jgi:hypothetical protein